MALTEENINDKIEVVNKGTYSVVQVRTATVIKRDGVEISRAFHRTTIYPNADLTLLDLDVSAVCAAVFTGDCKAAYAAFIASSDE